MPRLYLGVVLQTERTYRAPEPQVKFLKEYPEPMIDITVHDITDIAPVLIVANDYQEALEMLSSQIGEHLHPYVGAPKQMWLHELNEEVLGPAGWYAVQTTLAFPLSRDDWAAAVEQRRARNHAARDKRWRGVR